MDILPFDPEPLRELIRHHIPSEWMVSPVVAAVLCLVGGLILSLWGARMVRGLFILAFVGGGIWAGYAAGMRMQINPYIGAAAGAALLGVVGVLMFRLWIGVAWAALLTMVALTMLGSRQVLPHWGPFQEANLTLITGTAALDPYQPPTPEQQAEFNDPQLGTVLSRFGEYLTQQQPTLRRNALLLTGIAAVAGLLMGLIAANLTAIVATSVVGVGLMGTGATYFLQRLSPETLQTLINKPAASAAGLVVLLLLTMGVQWLQMRQNKPGAGAAAAPAVAA